MGKLTNNGYIIFKGKQNHKIIKSRLQQDKYESGVVDIKAIYFPKHMIGKRIRLKVEVIENDNT